MRQKPVLCNEDVLAIAAATRAEALRNGWAVTVALVDDGGHPVVRRDLQELGLELFALADVH